MDENRKILTDELAKPEVFEKMKGKQFTIVNGVCISTFILENVTETKSFVFLHSKDSSISIDKGIEIVIRDGENFKTVILGIS